MKGTYILLLECKKDFDTNMGSLGRIHFTRGNYAYVGSAMNSLERRIERHASKFKRAHWHIDYLTLSRNVLLRFAIYAETDLDFECTIGKHLSELKSASSVPGFGSSDCKQSCGSHLFFWKMPAAKVMPLVKKIFQSLSLEPRTYHMRTPLNRQKLFPRLSRRDSSSFR